MRRYVKLKKGRPFVPSICIASKTPGNVLRCRPSVAPNETQRFDNTLCVRLARWSESHNAATTANGPSQRCSGSRNPKPVRQPCIDRATTSERFANEPDERGPSNIPRLVQSHSPCRAVLTEARSWVLICCSTSFSPVSYLLKHIVTSRGVNHSILRFFQQPWLQQRIHRETWAHVPGNSRFLNHKTLHRRSMYLGFPHISATDSAIIRASEPDTFETAI